MKEIEELNKEIDKLEETNSDVIGLRIIASDLEDAVLELEVENKDQSEELNENSNTIMDLEDQLSEEQDKDHFSISTVYDEQKVEILKRIYANLNLDELQNLELIVKATYNRTKYNENARIY